MNDITSTQTLTGTSVWGSVVKYNDLASDFGAVKNIIIDSIIFWTWYITNDLWSMIYNQYDILSKHIYPIGIWKNGVNTHLHCIGICWWSTFGGLTGLSYSIPKSWRTNQDALNSSETVDGPRGQWNPAPVDGLSMFIPLYIYLSRVSTIQGGAGFRNHPQ